MNRMGKVIALLTLVLLLFGVQGAAAYTATVRWNNYVGSSDAVGRMQVINETATRWRAWVKSDMMDPPSIINVIGRTWWTVRELCEATWTQNYQYGGQYWSNSWYAKDKLVYKQPCVGMRFGRSMGAHDFHHTGRPRWQPTNDTQHVQVP